jgi:lipopolysaccharide export system ATP-binding protein
MSATLSTLRSEGLEKVYGGRKVVDGVSLSVKQGEIVGLLGPNGAGKTTTFYMVVGLERPDRGNVFFNEDDITTLPMHKRARRGVSYLPQEPSVFRKLSVRDNILAVLESSTKSRGEQQDHADQLLHEFGITKLAKSMAFSLSGGERRRLEICRSLALSPLFMLLDEPFAGIDPIAVGDIQRLIQGLRDRGLGILISDHNVRETLRVCDRAYVMNQGSVLEQGTPEVIANSARAREVYLGSGFKLD